MQLNAIISKMLSGSRCSRLLVGDGITVSDLSIKEVPGIIEATSIDVRSARKRLPAIGQAASIIKNLDEYQFLICSLVPSLIDSDPRKLQLQKYRVTVIAAFAMLVAVLRDPRQAILEHWNAHAGSLMEEISEAYLKAKSNSTLEVARHKEVFEFFGVPEDKIDAALAAFYGQ